MSNTKIIIAGTTVTMQSAHTLAELEKVGRYKPQALRLEDESGTPYFVILPGAFGSISNDGIVYGDTAPDGSEKAVVSIPLPGVPGKTAKEAVALTYGPAVANANKVEAQIDAALTEVNVMLAGVESSIVIAGPVEPVEPAECGCNEPTVCCHN